MTMRMRGVMMAMALTALLAGCESSEERAERHFQSAVQLLASGDVDRAFVELRSVFELNEHHLQARMVFAQLLEARGEDGAAFREYIAVSEAQPENLEALKGLTRIAAAQGKWDEAAPYLEAGLALAPDDPELQATRVGQTYAGAVERGDNSARRDAAREAAGLLFALPGELVLHRVITDNALRDQDFQAALTQTEATIRIAPEDQRFYMQRLAILSQMGDDAGVEAGLIDLIGRFPDNPENRATLVRWYLSRGETDKAEVYLRQAVQPGDADPAPRLTLVRFLQEVRGPEAALAELDTILAQGGDAPVFRAMRAGFLFDAGRQDEAVTEMEAVLEGAEPSGETHGFQVSLARMHARAGDAVAARALVEQVLTQDPGYAQALKMKADWLIDDDALSEAIALLRLALDQDPEDYEAMTLMAKAYARGGDTELMSEMLALAVEASNKAPGPSVRYADVLARAGKNIPAETVLLDSLRLNRDDFNLLVPLGRLYVNMEDWGRAETVARTLEKLGTEEAGLASRELRSRVLQGQNRAGEVVNYLQGLISKGQGGLDAKLAVLRTHVLTGDLQAARAYAAELLRQQPDNPMLRFVQGTVLAGLGESAAAERLFEGLLAEHAGREEVWVALYKLQMADGREDAARATLENGLTRLPNATELLWAKAGLLEAEHDIDGAIAIYEAMYARDSNNTVVANNLASLLASYRGDDPASLERAFVVARRLRGTDLPPFQDTYGWLVHLRGETEEALSYLEPAAAALRDDPLVQFHLARAYEALNRPEDALSYYRKVLALTGELDERDFVQAARTRVQNPQTDAGARN